MNALTVQEMMTQARVARLYCGLAEYLAQPMLNDELLEAGDPGLKIWGRER